VLYATFIMCSKEYSYVCSVVSSCVVCSAPHVYREVLTKCCMKCSIKCSLCVVCGAHICVMKAHDVYKYAIPTLRSIRCSYVCYEVS